MTDEERRMLTLVNDELRAIGLQIETLESAFAAAKTDSPVSLLGPYLTWRLAAYYRMETELKETRATLLAQEDA